MVQESLQGIYCHVSERLHHTCDSKRRCSKGLGVKNIKTLQDRPSDWRAILNAIYERIRFWRILMHIRKLMQSKLRLSWS